MNEILTIGYEGATIEDFLATLEAAAVRTLVDVRAVPVSRKRGFSKKALSLALECAGIAYRHLSDLGNPKPGRDAAKRGDREAFRRPCLLCFEREPADCHRAILAEEMARRGRLSVSHRTVRQGLAEAAEGERLPLQLAVQLPV